MKVGKFSKKSLAFDSRIGNVVPDGINAPAKKIWFGPILKNTAGGATMRLNVRGPTWGFTWVDFAEIASRAHTGTTLGMIKGTTCVFYDHNPTLVLSATLNAAQRCFMFIIGRTGGRS